MPGESRAAEESEIQRVHGVVPGAAGISPVTARHSPSLGLAPPQAKGSGHCRDIKVHL